MKLMPTTVNSALHLVLGEARHCSSGAAAARPCLSLPYPSPSSSDCIMRSEQDKYDPNPFHIPQQPAVLFTRNHARQIDDFPSGGNWSGESLWALARGCSLSLDSPPLQQPHPDLLQVPVLLTSCLFRPSLSFTCSVESSTPSCR